MFSDPSSYVVGVKQYRSWNSRQRSEPLDFTGTSLEMFICLLLILFSVYGLKESELFWDADLTSATDSLFKHDPNLGD